MNLFVLLDVSGSMRDRISPYFGRPKIEIAKDKLKEFVRKRTDLNEISLYTFSDTAKEIGVFASSSRGTPEKSNEVPSHVREFEQSIDKHSVNLGGGTKLWDCLWGLVNKVNKSEPSIILCVTDGEDGGSFRTLDEIQANIRIRPNVQLVIIDLKGTLPANGDTTSVIIRQTKEEDEIDDALQAIPVIPRSYPADSLDIFVPIYPIVECEDSLLEMVRSGIKQAVPYLEKLTGLRYYPVPTFIVDEYTMESFVPIAPVDNDPDELQHDISEILRFFYAVCLTVHTGRFLPLDVDPQGNNYYARLSHWSHKSREILVAACEGCVGVFDYLKGGSYWFGGLSIIPEMNASPDFLGKIKIGLYEVLNILKEIHRNRVADSLSHEYFNGRDFPDTSIWRRHLKDRFQKVSLNIDDRGMWKKELAAIIETFEITLPVLINLLQEWSNSRSIWYGLMRELHTYGVYFPPSSDNTRLEKLINEKGFPSNLIPQRSGKVLLCVDRIKRRVKECASGKPFEENLNEGMLPQIIASTLIHEHAHAITHEGIGAGEDQYFSNPSCTGKKYKAVSETLAEWAELNFFRDDPVLFDIVCQHAKSGFYPDWPYAGAIVLEESLTPPVLSIKYQVLMQCFRGDTNTAYRFLSLIK